MPAYMSGPGLGLALPQNLYPSALQNAPLDNASNRICLAPGQSLPLPAGDWYVSLGNYLIVQYLDPVTGVWTVPTNDAWQAGVIHVTSDGFNWRIANLLGCPIGAVVAAYGSGYVQGSTTITQTPGNGTWLPIVGGQLVLVGATLTSNGGGYGVAPIVFIPPPPPAANNPNGVGGIQAAAYAVIANGTVSGITFTNPGAGYPTAPTPVLLPNPTDPNLSTGITQAVAAFSLTGSGSITGALCTNSGAPLANPAQVTLSVAGAGTAGSVSAVVLQTVTAASFSGQGTGYGASATVGFSTIGGVPPQGSIANGPDSLRLSFRPRPAQIGGVTNAGGTLTTQLGALYDGGLFAGTPLVVIQQSSASNGSIVAATVALTMGGVPDIAIIQPAP